MGMDIRTRQCSMNRMSCTITPCDASAYIICAVVAHSRPDSSEKPIGYASHTLNFAEQNSQLKKEGFSLVFGIELFYSYLVIYLP